MKYLILFLTILIPNAIFSQIDYDYEITVIDSFTCNTSAQVGMAGLRAVDFNGNIYLSYFMQDTSSTKKLMYTIRTENGFVTETVAELNPELDMGYHPSTALQFDEFGNPHIYTAYQLQNGTKEIFAYEKVDNQWQGTFVAVYGGIPYLLADADGSNGLGLVFWAPPDPNWGNGQIAYASFDGDNWSFDMLSSNQNLPRTKPSIVNHNNKTYVVYGEGHCADTLISRIYVKENDEWSLDYEDVNLTTYNCGAINGLSTKLGKSNDGVYFLTGLRLENGYPFYLKNEGLGWQNKAVSFTGTLTAFGWGGANLVLDHQNVAFWINEDNGFNPNLSWITNDGIGGTIDLPHLYYDIWLHDFVIIDGYAYIYYWEGASAWPYGTPVTFKEIKIELNQLITSTEHLPANSDFSLEQNSPNPFSKITSIKFHVPIFSKVTLKLYNLMGVHVSTLVDEYLGEGNFEKRISSEVLADGTYFYVLSINGNSIARKMQLTR